MVQPNLRQQKAIENVKAKAVQLMYSKTAELKQCEITTDDEGWVAIKLVVGHKDDEGNALALLRKWHLIFIGKRGGLSAYNSKGTRVYGKAVWKD